MTYKAPTGETYTDADILRWAQEAENGFPNSTLEPVDGRPWEKDIQPMKIKAFRAPAALLDLLAKQAKKAGISESVWLREAITLKLQQEA